MLITRLAAVALLAALSTGGPAAASAQPAQAAARWLAAQQATDGSIPAAGDRTDQLAEAAASLAAAGQVAAASRGLDKVKALGFAGTTRGGQAGRLVAGVVAAGGDPRRLGGRDLVAHLRSFYEPATGRYDANLYGHSLAVLGLKAAADPVPPDAVRYFEINQCPDGGFGHEPGCLQGADVDTTAVAVTALLAGGRTRDDPSVAKARGWLASAPNDQAGFGDKKGAATNSNSTGLALSAIATLGETPGQSAWARNGRTAVGALAALQTSGGGFPYKQGGKVDGYATVQAIPGLLGRPLPLAPVKPPAESSPTRSAATVLADQASPDAGPGSRAAAPSSTVSTPAGLDAQPSATTPRRNLDVAADAGPRGESRPWALLVVALLAVSGAGVATAFRLKQVGRI